MMSLFKKQHGMNIIGQGGKIILFTLPVLIAAVAMDARWPRITALPGNASFLKPLGYALLLPGLALWVTAVVQLLAGFSKGRLVTTGAYGVVRNPLYASAAFFILPAIGLMTLSWGYFAASIALVAGVTVFIGREEAKLEKAFGRDYEDYKSRVPRLVPWGVRRARRSRG